MPPKTMQEARARATEYYCKLDKVIPFSTHMSQVAMVEGAQAAAREAVLGPKVNKNDSPGLKVALAPAAAKQLQGLKKALEEGSQETELSLNLETETQSPRFGRDPHNPFLEG